MIRSKLAITRLIALPYTLLLLLYLLVVGGGSFWLYGEVKSAETAILINKLMVNIQPLAERLRETDAISAARESQSWLIDDVNKLYNKLDSLRNITVRDKEQGYQLLPNMKGDAVNALAEDATAARQESQVDSSKRFQEETGELFKYSFDVSAPGQSLTRLEFSFDRQTLLDDLDRQLSAINHAILLFALAGAVSIALAVLITLFAMRTTRNLESHFQGIYQRVEKKKSLSMYVSLPLPTETWKKVLLRVSFEKIYCFA